MQSPMKKPPLIAEPQNAESKAVPAGGEAPSASQSVLHKIVPVFLMKQRSIVSNTGIAAGWAYATLWFMDAIGVRTSNQGLIPSSSRSLLFLCFGNIMRSPMAEALMKRALADAKLEQQIEVESAGLHATAGREAHPWALEAASSLGISLIHHRAKPLTKDMVNWADCILVMDFHNKAELMTLYPEAKSKIYLLSAYADGRGRYREISDPYLGDLETTKSCYRDLQTCIRNLMASTFSNGTDVSASQ